MARPVTLLLSALLEHPEEVRDLPPATAADLPLRLTVVTTALAIRAVWTPESDHAPGRETDDRLLDVREAAERLRVSADWLYRRAPRLPFTVRLGRTLRFSAAGLERYLRQRQGR